MLRGSAMRIPCVVMRIPCVVMRIPCGFMRVSCGVMWWCCVTVCRVVWCGGVVCQVVVMWCCMPCGVVVYARCILFSPPHSSVTSGASARSIVAVVFHCSNATVLRN